MFMGGMESILIPFINLALCIFSLNTRLVNTNEGVIGSVVVCVQVRKSPGNVSNPPKNV